MQPGRRVSRYWFLVALGASLLSREAAPIIMRHDVAEQRYRELARRYPAAVNIRPVGGEGTLIAPRWVLTAAHVGAGVKPGDLVVAGGKSYPIERVITHPDWHAMTDVKADIALILLKFAVPDVTPVPPFNGREVVGSIVTFVGRGVSGTGISGLRAEDQRVRAATNRIDKADGADLQFRFDRPGDPAVTELEGISGPGDSGGAAYLEQDGKTYVIGVSSWQDTRPTGHVQGLYGVIEHYVRVAYHYEWIIHAISQTP